MTEAKFTPGPWFLNDERDGYSPVSSQRWAGLAHVVVEPSSECNDEDDQRFREEGQANARLIAAAPDLYEALKPFASWIDRTDSDDRLLVQVSGLTLTVGDVRRAQAALAKATA